MSEIVKSTIIRAARPEDLPIIGDIVKRAYSVYLSRMDRKPFPMLEDYGARLANNQLSVLEANGRVYGYIVLVYQNDGSLLLDNIGVDPERQCMGYGAELLKFAEREASRMGLNRIITYTNEAMSENLGWYQKHGYEITGRCLENGYRRIYFAKRPRIYSE